MAKKAVMRGFNHKTGTAGPRRRPSAGQQSGRRSFSGATKDSPEVSRGKPVGLGCNREVHPNHESLAAALALTLPQISFRQSIARCRSRPSIG